MVGYNVFGTDRLRSEGSSLLAHEYLHTFGYPDLYRNSGNDRPVYSWSVMGGVIPGSPQYPFGLRTDVFYPLDRHRYGNPKQYPNPG